MGEQLANESATGKDDTAGLPHSLSDVIEDISVIITPLMESFGYRELPTLAQHRRSVCRRMDAYTYFAKGKWTGRIKIGRSNDPWRRVHELIRATNGEESDLLVVQPCENLEAFYHRAFAAFGVGNEWFSPAPEILAEIERLSSASHSIDKERR